MANIKITSKFPLYNGMPITFRAPCDCTAVEGLTVCYGTTEKRFAFVDAHCTPLAGIDNLFAAGAYLRAILNTEEGLAHLQNADNNGYIFGHISDRNNPHGVTPEQIGAQPVITYGTAEPTGGNPGDIYIQIIE